MPLILVAAILATLVTAPIIVSARARRIRSAISDVVDPARLHAGHVEAALAEEMLAVRLSPTRPAISSPEQYRQSLAAERRHALALDSLVSDLGPDGAEYLAVYRETASRWHADVDSIGPNDGLTHPSAFEADGMAAIASIDSLSALFDREAGRRRERARRIERVDVWLPVALVPLGLIACGLLIRAGLRSVGVSLRAERNRRALAVAVDQKSTFMRGLSHDLQNPLGAARGHLALIMEGVVKPQDERVALARVDRLIRDAIGTVSSLLAVARSDAGELPVTTVSIDLPAVASGAIDDYQLAAVTRRQQMSLVGASECRATGDVARVRHIIDNLISNASKYTPEGGQIRIGVSQRRRFDRAWSTLTIEDSGPGIPPDWRERIFNEFERVPSSRDTVAGTGIGLSVSRKVARMMGGDLTLEPSGVTAGGEEPLGGAVFTLWLEPA